MMKKRILILTLTFVFLVSTTGLPVFYHYCEMMGKKSVSECQMCKLETEEKEKTSCCSDEVYDNYLQLKSENTNCCIDQFDYKKIEDNFSQSLVINLFNSSVILATINPEISVIEKSENLTKLYNFDLPPPKFGKQLLQTIHQLKLALPVC